MKDDNLLLKKGESMKFLDTAIRNLWELIHFKIWSRRSVRNEVKRNTLL